MGLEVILGGLSAITGIIGGIAQANAAGQAAAAQQEAQAIESAQVENNAYENRRQRIREARIRRAQMLAAAENSGTSASSGAIGAAGAIGTNLAGLSGNALGNTKANQGITSNLQRAQNFQSQSNTIGAWTNTIQGGLNSFSTIFDQS